MGRSVPQRSSEVRIRREGRRAASVDEGEQLVEIDVAVRRERARQYGIAARLEQHASAP
jgi:hypothetical protein